MRYHNITKDDMLNGDGLRVVLWVSGCSHCCKECQNPVTWDPNGGLFLTKTRNRKFLKNLAEIMCQELRSAAAILCISATARIC